MLPLLSLIHVVEHLPLPVVLIERGGAVVGASSTAMTLLGARPTPSSPMHLDDHLSATAGPLLSALRTPIACEAGEHELVMLDTRLPEGLAPDAAALAGEVAHEFNNLLAVIINYATLAHASAPAGSRIREDLDEVLDASRRAATITERLREMSRADG